MSDAKEKLKMTEQDLPKHPRYYSLEIWRGISCLLVVVGHSLQQANMNLHGVNNIADKLIALSPVCSIGVPFFFVISGFCIAANADSIRRKSTHSSRTFFLRRFRRIYPPFWAALFIAGMTYWIVDSLHPGYFSFKMNGYAVPRELSAWQWLGNITLTEEWRHHLAGDGVRQILGPAWSLCYEEQFYAIVGIILAVAHRSFFRGVVFVTGLTLILKHILPRIGLNTNGFFFDGGWLAFGAGILVYYSINYLQPKRLWLPPAILAIGIIYALRGVLGVGSTVEQNLGQSFGFAALILFLSRFDNEMFHHKLLKPFLWCGAMCYSLYLVHLPVTTVLSRWMYNSLHITNSWGVLCITLPVCLLASILVSRLFYHMIEKRFLNKPVV